MLKSAFHRYSCVVLLLLLLLLLLGACVAQDQAPSMSTAAGDFVQQILARSNSPSAITVTFQNISSMPPEAQELAQNTIFSAFRNAGIRLVKPEAALAEVHITFSEDWKDYLWIADIKLPSGSRVAIKRIARVQEEATASTPTVVIHKTPVWQQDGPILDFYRDNQSLVLLEPEQISVYAGDFGQLRLRQTMAITHQHVWPRDLRGRLLVNGNQLAAFLPGTSCSGTLTPPALDCRASDDPWQLGQAALVAFFSPTRNFFTGILAGQGAGASVPPFFSAARWQAGNQMDWLFTGTDGRARLYQNDFSQPVSIFNGWGSDVAAIHSNCGSGWQLLAGAPGDSVHTDSVQAVEIAAREALPVSSPLDLAGPVEFLWTSGKNNEMVSAGVQSLATGKYEAFNLTVTCQ